MPTYEYRCANGHQFERFYKSISAAQAELPCPECNAVGARQLSGGAGLLFKGSGFYLTDYGKNAHRKGDSGTAGGGKSESGKADGAKGESATSGGAKTESAKPASESPKKAAESKPASKPKAE